MTFSVSTISEKFYIENAEMLSNGDIAVRFNLPVDEISAVEKENYSFEPLLTLESVFIDKNDPNLVMLVIAKSQMSYHQTNKFILTVKNIFSSSGIPIVQGTGSQIAITFIATSLQQAIIFPNPYTSEQGTGYVTFSNLIKGTSVKIISSDGKVIRSLVDENINGTIHWDLKDENGNEMASGIYLVIFKKGEKRRLLKLAIIR